MVPAMILSVLNFLYSNFLQFAWCHLSLNEDVTVKILKIGDKAFNSVWNIHTLFKYMWTGNADQWYSL